MFFFYCFKTLSGSNKGVTTCQVKVLHSFSVDPADSCEKGLFFKAALSEHDFFLSAVSKMGGVSESLNLSKDRRMTKNIESTATKN